MFSYLSSWMNAEDNFTSTSPLPPSIAPDRVIEILHDHATMVRMNPLVIDLQRCEPHEYAPEAERSLIWYEITDKVSYLPFGLLSGEVKYKACFEDLPSGLWTHVYAPLGLSTKNTWTVEGQIVSYPAKAVKKETAPPTNDRQDEFQLKEDVNMECNVLMAPFVKRTIKASHGPLVDRLIAKAKSPESDPVSSVEGDESVRPSVSLV